MAQNQYKALPVAAQKAYQLYLDEHFSEFFKKKLMAAALFGWFLMLGLISLVIIALTMIYLGTLAL